MNGVIIDDEYVHEMAFGEVLQPFGISISHQDYLENCAGRTDKAGFEAMEKKFSRELPIDDLLDRKSEAYLRLFPIYKKSCDGVIDLIKNLSKSFVLALTSSASRAEIDLVLKEFEINSYFKIIVSADDVSEGKPNPEPYLKTTSMLGLRPEECVVIEDSRSGVVSAKAAGCFCIGVTTTHPRDMLTDADLVVDSFEEIFVAIGKINN